MNNNSHLSDSYKKVSVSSMLIYIKGLSVKNLENVINWAKTSKNPNANVNTSVPNEWEKDMKSIFAQLTLKEQTEVISQAVKILEEKRAFEAKKKR